MDICILREFFYGQYKLLGSTMGSKEALHDMLAFFEKHAIHPVVDRTFPLSETKQVMDYLEKGKQFGKVAIQISTK